MMRQIHGIKPFKSDDPDSERIFWEDGGVHQNLTFPVQPDPISGQHCWHQKVTIGTEGRRIAMATFSSTRTSRTRCIADGSR